MDEMYEPDSSEDRIEMPSIDAPSASASVSGARYKLLSPAKLPISRTTRITIPPGLSPTALLESPILLSNVKAEPSPTTGSFFNPQMSYGLVGSSSYCLPSIPCPPIPECKTSSFEFRPPVNPLLSFDQVQSVCSSLPIISSPRRKIEVVASPNEEDRNQSLRLSSGLQASNSENKAVNGGSVLSGDGYNWRKYGQKHVKGSEFPRSYYKCTHPNCEVKKLFERSHDGQITEIIYKGTHDHPKPQNNRRYSAGSVFPVQEGPEKLNSFPLSNGADKQIYGQVSQTMDPSSTPEQSPGGNDDNVDGVEEDEDSLAKKRKMDAGLFDVTPVIKPIREPRVVVQTLSEVDILDDGYRWRKYGQKVVRGNPNPRSYYKCTHSGCPVRKHVERASHDPKAVITTYEGKHNHDVPTSRTTSHDMGFSAVGNSLPVIRSDEKHAVSLDLGVGMATAPDGIPNQNQHEHLLFTQNQNQVSGSNFVITEGGYYGMNQYGARPNPAEENVDMLPLNNSYPYPQNVGRILSGP